MLSVGDYETINVKIIFVSNFSMKELKRRLADDLAQIKKSRGLDLKFFVTPLGSMVGANDSNNYCKLEMSYKKDDERASEIHECIITLVDWLSLRLGCNAGIKIERALAEVYDF